jgi:hypothetical protein
LHFCNFALARLNEWKIRQIFHARCRKKKEFVGREIKDFHNIIRHDIPRICPKMRNRFQELNSKDFQQGKTGKNPNFKA